MKIAENLPPGMTGLAPHLVCDGAAAAIDFYKKAFDAEEFMRLPGPDGKLMHAAVSINGAMVMLVDEFPDMQSFGPKKLKGTPVVLHLSVANVDEAIAQAEKAGAKVVMPAADMFWGDRYGQVEDPFGHLWSIATPGKQLTPEQIAEAAKNAGPCGEV